MARPITPHTLIELPPELRGSLVFLRPYRADDAEQVFAAIDESRDHLRPWMEWVDEHQTVDDTRDFCLRSAASWLLRTNLGMGIFDSATERFLGGTGLHEPDWELRSFAIGYWLRSSATGSGYATEAVRLLVDLALTQLGARRVALTCDVDNIASRRVAERTGFALEARLRNARLNSQGNPSDTLVFALIPDDRQSVRPGA